MLCQQQLFFPLRYTYKNYAKIKLQYLGGWRLPEITALYNRGARKKIEIK